MMAALKEMIAQYLPSETVKMYLRDLNIGMILADGLFNRFGTKLMAEGLEVTDALLSRIKNMSERGLVVEPFNVNLPSNLARELTDAIQVENMKELVVAGR
jgi:hypothetical protein